MPRELTARAGLLRERLPAVIALALPSLAGLVYLVTHGAPESFPLFNAGALLAAAALILLCPPVAHLALRRVLVVMLLALLFAPLLTGPWVSGVMRWLPLGPFVLHSGMLLVPALVALAARDRDYAAPILLTGVLAAFFQPDAATGFALTFAAVGLHDVTRDWKIGVSAIVAFFATLVMAMRGELPPQPFVERVLADLSFNAPLVALALFLALVAAFFLILRASGGDRGARYAMAGSLFGFTIMAMISHYPTPLIGYGAAPILGYGLALALNRTAPTGPARESPA